MMTDAKREAAARELCRLQGRYDKCLDDDERAMVTRFAAREVLAFEQMQAAIAVGLALTRRDQLEMRQQNVAASGIGDRGVSLSPGDRVLIENSGIPELPDGVYVISRARLATEDDGSPD